MAYLDTSPERAKGDTEFVGVHPIRLTIEWVKNQCSQRYAGIVTWGLTCVAQGHNKPTTLAKPFGKLNYIDPDVRP